MIRITLIVIWQGILTLSYLAILISQFLRLGWIFIIDLPAINPFEILFKFLLASALIFIPVSTISSIGLLQRRNWGRILSILSMILVVPLIILLITSYSTPFVVGWDIVIPVSFTIALLGVVTLIIIFLNSQRMKEVFKSQQNIPGKYNRIAVSIVLGIPVLLGLISPIGYHYISRIIETRQIIEDFNRNVNLWNQSKIKDYSYKIIIAYGGHSMWEGFGGISSGGNKQSELIVEVRNGKPASLKNFEDDQLIDMTAYQYSNTIPELFSIISSFLNGNVSEDVRIRINNSSELQKNENTLRQIPFSIAELYNIQLGYPEKILVYKQIGSKDYFERYFFVTYYISDFKVLSEN
jgi:hypothetical protein